MAGTHHILTPPQLRAIEICTRTMSVLSLLGSCYIISSFLYFAFYRKPINRLVFYATWGNILANVATLISTSGIPTDGQSLNALCEFQGVLIQWFLMADSFWVFCMATNVFLVFWRGYDAIQLRHLEKWYLLLAYGVPAIPPLVYVILDHVWKTPIMGPATLWCWVASDYDWMRIALFYGPVWLIVSATMAIYIATGIKIVRRGALLRFFVKGSQQKSQDSTIAVEAVTDPFVSGKNIIVTTQIEHDVHHHDLGSRHALSEVDHASLSSYSSTKNLSKPVPRDEIETRYSDQNRASLTSRDLRPSPGIRVSPYLHDEDTSAGYRATVFATNPPSETAALPPGSFSAATHQNSHIKRAAGNAAALAYLKVAFLMFIALIVVWVPSSVNRLDQFMHHNKANFPLSLISAIVLPMQGTWNATIYIYTTQAEYWRAYAIIRSKITGKAAPYRPRREHWQKDTLTSSSATRDTDPEIQLEEGLKQGDDLRHSESLRDGSISSAGLR
ncbi:hypothetical protein HBH98_021900 [Parastagonospora nodorum]|nr:hypothetical protein HBH53_079950 [Parastagonospora nodorum]KAH4041914.1 hypothetical protein HBI09_006120 [Parastagonospora nodorum]KAH4073565.1 hypothetical protein HBH50_055880 [Parastagonospora nodorum]KAH4099372.1 hypothetical protein HBH48_006240 [Parastagonospora nodorum]KAH4110668.1 hypothetical protein HBH46_005770 [Parastagonospora nodorum]